MKKFKQTALRFYVVTHFLVFCFIRWRFGCFDLFLRTSNRSSLDSWLGCRSQAAQLWGEALSCHAAQSWKTALHDELNGGLAHRGVGGQAGGQSWRQGDVVTVRL